MRALLLAFALGAALPVPAQVLYKLIAPDGRVTYTDKEPKNFEGRVVRIDPDTESNMLPSGKAGEKATRPSPEAAEGLAATRRKAREELEKKLRAAEARVEAARKAKADGEEIQPEEMQTIQRRYPPLAPGQSPPRPNCFASTDPNGNASLVCPQVVPQEAYFERRKKLDEDLRLAEEELAAAERAYRRGTD